MHKVKKLAGGGLSSLFQQSPAQSKELTPFLTQLASGRLANGLPNTDILTQTANLSNIMDSPKMISQIKGADKLLKGKMGGLSTNLKDTFSVGNLGNIGLGAANSILSGLNPGKEVKNELDSARNTVFKTGNQIASMFGPVGMGVSAVNNIIDMTGGFSDTSKGLGGGNDALNMISSIALPGAGWFTKRLDDYKVSDTLGQSSSYTGVADTNQKVSDNIAGRKIIFGRGKAKNKINDAKQKDTIVQQILGKSKDDFLASQNVQQYQLADNLSKNASDWMYNIRAGKKGMKISEAKRIAKLAKGKKPVMTGEPIKSGTTVEAFREGGSVNVIPDGALHARKHNLEEINPEFESLTKKGIPVITKDEGGVVQHAEVEVGEIIFTLEVTEELEKLREEGTEEAAIKAGMLLAEQIMENTQDNTEKILHNED